MVAEMKSSENLKTEKNFQSIKTLKRVIATVRTIRTFGTTMVWHGLKVGGHLV